MPFIPKETIREILQANPIQEVVGHYVRLLPDGKNLKGLCPFHNEKTPSFKVHPGKQVYRCYGCGEYGNAISFVMAMDRLDFVSAVKMLAERAGIRLSAGKGLPTSLLDQARRANELACEFYRRQLRTTGFGEKACEYLNARGIDEECRELFRLGAAPESWDNLHTYLQREGISPRAMLEAGLIAKRKRGDGFYDYLRGRLLFPIMDGRSRVVGFGGRTLTGGGPKYLNTPETRFFKKGRVLYGQHLATDYFRRHRRALIFEGYTDVIMAVKHGIEGAVACLGTALTKANAGALKRHVDRVTLVYDGDEAGVRAAERAIGPLLEEGLEVAVVLLPAGLDPCDFLTEKGPQSLSSLVANAKDAVPFLAERAKAVEGAGSAASLRKAVERTISPLKTVRDNLMQELLSKQVAEAFGITESSVLSALEGQKEKAGGVNTRKSRYPPPEELLLCTLIAEPCLQNELPFPDRLKDSVLNQLYQVMRSQEDSSVETLQAQFAGTEAGEKLVAVLALVEETEHIGEILDWKLVAQGALEELKKHANREKLERVKSELAELGLGGEENSERRETLIKEYQLLLRRSKVRPAGPAAARTSPDGDDL